MIRIICFGKIKESYLTEMINDYQKRISKYHKIDIIELKEERTLDKEAESINKYISKNNYLIVTDINGEDFSSVKLSEKIESIFSKGYGNIDIIIGSSEGISDIIKIKADMRISFSKMTFPHGLFRGILLEQIYRSFKILNNETYHK